MPLEVLSMFSLKIIEAIKINIIYNILKEGCELKLNMKIYMPKIM